MRRGPPELVAALLVGLALTAFYMALSVRGVPAAGGLVGHGLGILGFALMLLTEVGYSLRKRSRRRALGHMSSWLRVHIVAGIIGPYLVLLHTGFRFAGLAGVLTLAVMVVVASGFVGRYLYTALPRTAEGPAAAHLRRLLATWHTVHVPLGMAMFGLALAHVVAALYYGGGLR